MRTIALLACMCLMSCSLLKKTTKTESVVLGEFEKVVDSRSLVLKTAIRETNTLTYNPDGSILQFQQIQEEAAQSQALQVRDAERETLKKELVIKESVPSQVWVLAFIAAFVLSSLLWYVKMRFK
ncbi:MAG: hypothetical protein WKF66_00190 [Pedobacter sp.]